MLDNRVTTYLLARLVKRLIKYKTRGNHEMVAKINSQIDQMNKWMGDNGFTYDQQFGWSK